MRELWKQYKVPLLLGIYAVLTFPFFYSSPSNGLDSSWSYALSKFNVLPDIKCGKDWVFTYGPLGFLEPECGVICYIIATLIFIFLFLSTLILFRKLVKDNSIPEGVIYVGILLAFLGGVNGSVSKYVQYCVFLSLAVLWKNMDDTYAAVFFAVAAPIAFMYKFSVAIVVMGAGFLFFVSKLLMRDYRRIWVLLLPLLTMPVSYLIYHFSVNDLFRYITGSLEISEGYNVAMSISAEDPHALWIFVMMALYIALMVTQLTAKEYNNFYVMLWFAPSFFMAYKQGFVRADPSHSVMSFRRILIMLAVLVFLFDFRPVYEQLRAKNRRGIVQGGLILTLLTLLLLNNTGLHPVQDLTGRIYAIPDKIAAMLPEEREENIDDLEGVPSKFHDEIGNSTFTSYPWEITFIEKDRDTAKNFVPLPTLQIYSTYTPYLDELTAELFDGEKAPEYIIFKFDTIDGRIPLLEVPATWQAIREHYELAGYDKDTDRYLLKYRNAGTEQGKQVTEANFDKEDTILFQDCSELRINAELSFRGWLTKMLWKIPAVEARITYNDDTVREGRVLLDNLSGGIINAPYDLHTLSDALNGEGQASSIRSIQLFGDGLQYYKDNVRVEYVYYTTAE